MGVRWQYKGVGVSSHIMNRILLDVRYASRKFLRSPGLTLAAIVTLSLGIGANTAIFSMVDGIWLRPLPVVDPSHLIAVESVTGRRLLRSG